EWLNVQAMGRHLIDLRILAQNELSDFDLEKQSDLPSLLKFLGISPTEYHAPPANNSIKKELQQHLQLLQILSSSLSPKLFSLTKWCPFNYGMMNHLSPMSKVESLLFREYIHRKHSVPKPYEQFSLAPLPAETFFSGIFSDVLLVSFHLLPARIAVQEHIVPRTDQINVFEKLLQELFQLISDHPSSRGLQLQKAATDLLEAFPEYLTHSKGLFNDPMCAEQLYILRSAAMEQSLKQFEPFNTIVIHYDADGYYLRLPENVIGAVNIKKFVERLSVQLPYGTNFIAQKMFQTMLAYNKRNFVLLDEQQRIIIRGSALQQRGMERFLRVLIHRTIECLFMQDAARIHHTFASAHTQIVHHRWSPADFCKIETAKESLDLYQHAVATGNRQRTPAMEAALRAGYFVKSGEKLSYYLTGTDPESDPLLNSKLGVEWDSMAPDENTAHYLKRLQETIEKFQIFFEPIAFQQLISLDELFPFSPAGITIIERKLIPSAPSSKMENDNYGIWLADSE
ncbi:MAG TPA: hypothetical protein VMU30_08285, partial [Bacteroidota bacterium]|nr:hypothetical protein [Bacteroidota bacterium]